MASSQVHVLEPHAQPLVTPFASNSQHVWEGRGGKGREGEGRGGYGGERRGGRGK